ncbi:MAG: hypothetical protein IPG34_17270 [Rhodocyclaceae bacterium]|nr:hypothetical protein [Rhodocyclaceae bacterium]
MGAQKSTGSQPVASGNSALGLSWQVPAQIKVGEQFSAVLRVSSQAPLRGVPLLAGYDPLALQAIGVEEGDFLKQGGGQTSFSERVDMAEGRCFWPLCDRGGSELGVNGTGTLATITFIALKPQSATKLNVLSVTPDPAPIIPLTVPIEQTVKIIQ